MARPVVRSGGRGIVEISFVPPLEFIARQHGSFAQRLADLGGLWARFAPIMSEVVREQFTTRGHGSWPPLAASTLAEKARLGYPSDPLVRTGALRDSLIDPVHAMRAGLNEMVWQTDVDYAAHHHFGGSIAGRPPERQLFPDPMPPTTRRRFESAMVGWLNDCARAAYSRRAA